MGYNTVCCSGICRTFEYRRIRNKRAGYNIGVKRCNSCEIYLVYDGVFCPCCNRRLRYTSRYKRFMIDHARY